MIEAFIAGTPAREIARWAHPRVAHNTISRYMRARVRPALNNAARLFAVDPPRTGAVLDGEAKKKTRDVATQQTERPQMERDQAEQLAMEALVAAPALSIFRARLEKIHDRVDRALDRAETAVRVIEKDGKLVAAGVDLGPIAPLFEPSPSKSRNARTCHGRAGTAGRKLNVRSRSFVPPRDRLSHSGLYLVRTTDARSRDRRSRSRASLAFHPGAEPRMLWFETFNIRYPQQFHTHTFSWYGCP
jgi:hypothetical protein